MIHKAVINLLLLIMAMQPVLAFGQFTTEPTDAHSRADQMAMMACCDDGLRELSEHSEQDMACGDMASADCTLAASLGNCSAMLFGLVPEKAGAPTQPVTSLTPFHLHDSYLSIILDTLTPPPNASKA
ncbi:MAG: hypothetical protein V7713_16860 [Marinobacter sp.]|uniref:hypothetical protein n=1 Tax=Marinobacter sp. AC-23 TaxID=1879031 RepID=UPI0008DD053B|nr:hypothetical protein [Marinobacter sp. AC-23]OHY73661.1 hypothetical protein BCA33_18375 [Marinobacter sp. AC-23]